MKKYRKKPVVVEAVQLTDDADWEEIAEWCSGAIEDIPIGESGLEPDSFMRIPTLEGVMAASEGDWIIKGIRGEFYPCKPDIFEATYEEVTP